MLCLATHLLPWHHSCTDTHRSFILGSLSCCIPGASAEGCEHMLEANGRPVPAFFFRFLWPSASSEYFRVRGDSISTFQSGKRIEETGAESHWFLQSFYSLFRRTVPRFRDIPIVVILAPLSVFEAEGIQLQLSRTGRGPEWLWRPQIWVSLEWHWKFGTPIWYFV